VGKNSISKLNLATSIRKLMNSVLDPNMMRKEENSLLSNCEKLGK
jgi:hypothetical protein